jgi:16S rRNA (guanine527-N7)-methyltransferase
MGSLSAIMSELHDVEISTEEENLLLAYLDLVIEKNKEINLTRIDSKEEDIVLHLEDSLLALPVIKEYAIEGRLIDLGSGAGFPGVPLAVTTQRNTVLVDSVRKKMSAVSEMLDDLNIQHLVETNSERIEELGKKQRSRYSIATARALSKMVSILELASPLLKVGGICICYKGSPDIEELESVKKAQRQLGFQNVSRETFSLSNGAHREIFVFKKVEDAHIKLPRRTGLAQHHPIA